MFTSDGTILAKGFVLLEDDKALQPSENLVPAVRSEIIDAYGDDFVDALDAASAKLTTAELISLNKLVGIDGEDPETVVADWLKAVGITE
jgi:osmoprotectant transport system substrate-binding protein